MSKLVFCSSAMKYRYNVALFLITLFLSSCVKDDANRVFDNPGSLSSLAAFNAVPGTSEVNLFLDGVRFNNTNEKFSFGEFMRHRNSFPGQKRLNIEGMTTKGEPLRTSTGITLQAENIYSLFLYEEGGIQVKLSKDNIVVPRDGYAKIRFVHMVKDAPALSMWDKEQTQPLFGNIPFKDVTEFIEVKANESLSLKIIPTGDRNKTPEISQTFVPENRTLYTLMLVGLLNSDSKDEEVSLKSIKL